MVCLFQAGYATKSVFFADSKSTLNLNTSNNRGWTALMFAARNGHGDITKALIKEG